MRPLERALAHVRAADHVTALRRSVDDEPADTVKHLAVLQCLNVRAEARRDLAIHGKTP
jgi:hypothetical protein